MGEQYVLDNFATVQEAVDEVGKEAFRVVPVVAPNGAEGTVHLSISDPSGDSAIFGLVKGKLVIHHGRQYQVMTNSPVFEEQIALNRYWEQIGGTVMLPGTKPGGRPICTGLILHQRLPAQSADPREAVASVFSVMRDVSVPRGITTPDQPNISSTIWRTVWRPGRNPRVYYFEGTASPGLLWVRLDDVDFSPESTVSAS